MLHFDRFTVKHALQNTQNDCHQWLSHSHSFRVHQIRFRPGLRPGPRWGAYSAPPDPLAGLRWALLLRGRGGEGTGEEGEGKGREGKGRGREGKERGEGKEKREGEEKGPAPPFGNSWIRPCTAPSRLVTYYSTGCRWSIRSRPPAPMWPVGPVEY